MVEKEKKAIPVREGLWSLPSGPGEKPQLIASRCRSCGEIFFPSQQICTHCQSQDLEETRLGRKGRISSHTVVMQRPSMYKGPVPYAIGYVEFPEGVRVETLFTGGDPNGLESGMEVEMVIEKLCEDDEGNEVMAYMFRPIRARSEGGLTE